VYIYLLWSLGLEHTTRIERLPRTLVTLTSVKAFSFESTTLKTFILTNDHKEVILNRTKMVLYVTYVIKYISACHELYKIH